MRRRWRSAGRGSWPPEEDECSDDDKIVGKGDAGPAEKSDDEPEEKEAVQALDEAEDAKSAGIAEPDASRKTWPRLARGSSSALSLRSSPSTPAQKVRSSASVKESEAGSKGSKSAVAESVSGCKTVDKWIGRISLQKIVEGAKLGVDLNLAKDALPKLEPGHRTQLQLHIAHAGRCQKLAPEGLRCASASDILENIAALESVDVCMPVAVWRRLLVLELQARVMAVRADCREDTLQQLWSSARPHSHPGEGLQFEKSQPKLSQLSIAPEEKTKICESVWLSDVLTAFVCDGQVAAEKIGVVSKFLTKVAPAEPACMRGVAVRQSGCSRAVPAEAFLRCMCL